MKTSNSRLYELVDAVHDSQDYISSVETQVDIEQWMRVLAFERIRGNIDAYSRWNGHNMYAYRPATGRWQLLPFDLDLVMGTSPGPTDVPTTPLSSTPVEDPKIWEMLQTPAFQRAYWRAFQEAVNGPLLEANYGPVVQAAYQLLREAGIKQDYGQPQDVAAPGDALPRGFTSWINGRRNYILSQLQTVAAAFAITSPSQSGSSSYTLAGTAPVQVATIQVRSQTATVAGPLSWPTVTSWVIPLILGAENNEVQVQGYDRHGQALSECAASIVIRYNP